jgi:DTW domain-containing protein YfiP
METVTFVYVLEIKYIKLLSLTTKDVQVLGWDRHENEAELNQMLGSQPSASLLLSINE